MTSDCRGVRAARSSRFGLRPAAVAAALVAITVGLGACGASGGDPATSATRSTTPTSSSKAASPSPSATPSSSAPPATVVKVTTKNSDGDTYGVGMPVIVFFSAKITSAKAWQDGTTVTADGKPLKAAWFFEPSSAGNGPYEAHLRPQDYWPAHSQIHISFPAKGTSLGGNYVSDGALTSLDFSIGARNVSTINSATHQMTVTSDGQTEGTYPVSLGAGNTPTFSGTKVIMEKTPTTCMHDTAGTYYECGIKWDQRLTYSGEYLHSAPWNVGNIGRVNTSNGCTNLLPADAQKLYNFFEVGDVFTYPNADGPAMTLGQGYGDWNVSWSQWVTGGAVSTTA